MQKKSLNYKTKSKTFFEVLVTVLLFIVLAVSVMRVALSLFYIRVYVIGSSMSGTIEGAANEKVAGGEYVYAFRSSSPNRGDIVIVKPENKKDTIIKRVIALGGDRIELKQGVLYLNGEVKEEWYILPEHNTPTEPNNTFAELTVPAGCMFCMGDNRNVSSDSRSEFYGCMPVVWTEAIVADWSMALKKPITDFNTYFDFTLPDAFGIKK